VKTSAFPWYSPPFDEYNVAQAAAVPFLDKDVNLVVSFATAVGKTVLAECCFAYHLKTNAECRVVYVCPFRSLAAEKHGDWRKGPLGAFGVVLGSSDAETGMEAHMAGRISVMTTESFDSKTRLAGWRPWMESLDCVVFDEAHLLATPGRGAAMEASMMRLTAVCPKARLVLLSATMGNAMDVARWVKSLNGKATKCVTSSWKPSETRISVVGVDGSVAKMEKVVELVKCAVGRKVMVFVHAKATGNDLVRALRRSGVRTAFHNASLAKGKRRRIEEAFNDQDSGFDVLVSTSTLGAGVNVGG
jgi:replicative superfamily II helicase